MKPTLKGTLRIELSFYNRGNTEACVKTDLPRVKQRRGVGQGAARLSQPQRPSHSPTHNTPTQKMALIHNLMAVQIPVPYFCRSRAHCSGVRVFCSKAWMCGSSSARHVFTSLGKRWSLGKGRPVPESQSLKLGWPRRWKVSPRLQSPGPGNKSGRGPKC